MLLVASGFGGRQLERVNCGLLAAPSTSQGQYVLWKSMTTKTVQLRPNNSFKPSPLRGLVYAVTCTTTLGRYAGRLNSGVRLAMNRFAKVAAIVAILIAAAMFVTPFILYFGIIAGTIAAVLKHDRHTR